MSAVKPPPPGNDPAPPGAGGYTGPQGFNSGSYNAGTEYSNSIFGGMNVQADGYDLDPGVGNYGAPYDTSASASGSDGNATVWVGHQDHALYIGIQQSFVASDGNSYTISSHVEVQNADISQNIRPELLAPGVDSTLASSLAQAVSSQVQGVASQGSDIAASSVYATNAQNLTNYNSNLLQTASQVIQNDFLGGGNTNGALAQSNFINQNNSTALNSAAMLPVSASQPDILILSNGNGSF